MNARLKRNLNGWFEEPVDRYTIFYEFSNPAWSFCFEKLERADKSYGTDAKRNHGVIATNNSKWKPASEYSIPMNSAYFANTLLCGACGITTIRGISVWVLQTYVILFRAQSMSRINEPEVRTRLQKIDSRMLTSHAFHFIFFSGVSATRQAWLPPQSGAQIACHLFFS